MLVMSGEGCKLHRKVSKPLFYPATLKSYLPLIKAKTKSFLDSFDSKLSSNEIDMCRYTMDFALDSSLATFFGVDDVSEKTRFQFVEHMEK